MHIYIWSFLESPNSVTFPISHWSEIYHTSAPISKKQGNVVF